jgi:transposase
MASGTLLAADYLTVDKYVSMADRIEIVAHCRRKGPLCPLCGTPARRVQSRYERRLADLPWHGVAVQLILQVRRFFCDAEDCTRRIFAEPIPEVAARHARKTTRLALAVELIGFALGGRPGARTAAELGVLVGRDTLLRAVRRAPTPQAPPPRVVGVDDWAMRRGRTYGTIVVDLERRCPIDLLPDREAGTLADWLARRPGIEIVSRDRAPAYADGARQGAPDALQVADRWHLIRNLGDAVERMLSRHRSVLREVARVLSADKAASEAEGAPLPTSEGAKPKSKSEIAREEGRERRVRRYEAARKLAANGYSKRAIARELDVSRQTIRRLLAADVFPERATSRRRSKLDVHAEYIRSRWDDGCRNARMLWRELVARGYQGCDGMVRRYVASWRPPEWRRPGRKPPGEERRPRPKTVAPLSPRQAMWLVTREEEAIEEKDRPMRARLLAACADIGAASQLALGFTTLVRERKSKELDSWVAAAKASGLIDLVSFARGLEKSHGEVAAALEVEWSNGQTEGQVNKLKMLKRTMFGRANFDLLRKRMLGRR